MPANVPTAPFAAGVPAVTRQRRRRLHAAGDHSICKPDRCPDAAPSQLGGGEIEDALLAFVAELGLERGDPRLVTAKVAVRLAQALDRHPQAAAAGQLQSCLHFLGEDPNAEPDAIDEIRARFAQRRVESLLAWPDASDGAMGRAE